MRIAHITSVSFSLITVRLFLHANRAWASRLHEESQRINAKTLEKRKKRGIEHKYSTYMWHAVACCVAHMM